jgi:hypothetical protein
MVHFARTQMVRFVVSLLVALATNSPVHAQTQQHMDDMLAGVLMRNGLLCSRVLEKSQGQGADEIEVTCIEYRGATRSFSGGLGASQGGSLG